MAENGSADSVDDSLSTETSISRNDQLETRALTRRTARPLITQGASLAERRGSQSALSSTTGPAQNPSQKKLSRNFRSTLIMALAVPALFGTVALPAYALGTDAQSASKASAQYELTESGAQSLKVDEDVVASTVARDGYSATTVEELAAARSAAEAAAQRQNFAATVSADTNPTASELLETPKYSSGSLAQVFQVALQYQGVPYVFGGATPAGFDCSGFIKYVYAQFGVNLPHSSTAQGNMGQRISWEEAVPGDLVVRPGHIGFYAGDGMMLHASQPGVPLRISPIYYKAESWVVRIPV